MFEFKKKYQYIFFLSMMSVTACSIVKKPSSELLLPQRMQPIQATLDVDKDIVTESRLHQRLLKDTVNVHFSGDAEDILRVIAIKYGYGFFIKGKRPRLGTPVKIQLVNAPMVDVFKQIGEQAKGINILLKPDQIEINYPETLATQR